MTDKRFPGVRGPNFTKLGEDGVRSFIHRKFVLTFGYLDAFSNVSGPNLSDVENDAKFRIPPVKIRECGRDNYTNYASFKNYNITSEIH